MLTTLSLRLRPSAMLSQPAVRDSLFLVVIAVLSMATYITSLGFYSDDWPLLGYMKLSPDQSLTAVFTAVDASQDNEVRPIQFLGYAVPYKLFGLDPLGYHLLNGAIFVLGVIFIYKNLIALGQPRLLALAVPIIFMLLPTYSTDRFWIAAHATNLAMCLTFIGIYFHLRALRHQASRFWVWEALAVLCIIASGFTYEVFLPLVVATAALLFLSELMADSAHAAGIRAVARTALRQLAIVVAVALVILVKAKWAARVGKVEITSPLWIADYIAYIGHYLVKAFAYSYGYHLLELPSTAWDALLDHYDLPVVIMAGLIGIAIFLRLYTLWDRPSDGAPASRSRMLMYLGCGILLFIAGYSLVPINPAKDGINNRSAIAGTVGVAVSAVGFLGLLLSFRTGQWRKVAFGGIVAFIGMSGALIIGVLGNFWEQSYRLQTEILADIRSHIPALPAGSTLILDGVCRYSGPAPVFEAPWDLAYGLALYYGHGGIQANVVSRELIVGENGLIVPSIAGPVNYSFGQLYVYRFDSKKSFALPNEQTAEHYFDKISTDRADRCPADFYGNGVDVFDGVIPMLGKDPTTIDLRTATTVVTPSQSRPD